MPIELLICKIIGKDNIDIDVSHYFANISPDRPSKEGVAQTIY